jgi:hypothetical protein
VTSVENQVVYISIRNGPATGTENYSHGMRRGRLSYVQSTRKEPFLVSRKEGWD